MCKTSKLIKDCKPGDLLHYVIMKPYGYDYSIIKVIVDNIKHDPFLHDTYTCKMTGCDLEVVFNYASSDHDNLILDTDHATVNNSCYERVYTTYEGAVEWIMTELKYSIHKQLDTLERLERNNGVYDSMYKTRTKHYKKDGYRLYKKVELYLNDYGETPKEIDKILENKKINVYKTLIETDYNGNIKYSGEEHFEQSFDYLEDALEFIHKNDKSFYHGKLDSWFEGYHYFIKD